jgi:iron complex outermembrane receptor protein
VMANLDGDIGNLPYRGNFGVRVVHTDNSSRGMVWDDDEDEGPKESFARVEDGFDYWDTLPSANIVLMPTEKLLIRLAATKVMTRPELGDVTSSVKYIYDDRVDEDTPLSVEDSILVKMGNARLEPFRAWQYDAAVEYYTDSGGLINVGLFYKDVDSFITSAQVDYCGDPTGGGWLPGGEPGFVDGQCYFSGDDQNGTIDYAQTINGEGAVIKGVEIGIQQVFTDMWPSPWEGFGVQANYTYIDSTSPIKDVTTGQSLPLEGISETSYNLVLFYEKYDFSGRLAYNYRSEYLVTAFDTLSDSSVMRDGRGQLDVSLSYDINDHLSVYLNGINLTDEVKMDYVAHKSRLRNWTMSGRRYQLGFRWAM